jgi:hypothetical protein
MLSLADLARVPDALPAVLLVGNLFRRVPIVSLFGAFPVTRLNAAGDSEFVQYFRGTALSERVSHQQSCHLLCAARQDAKRMLAAGEAKAEQIGTPTILRSSMQEGTWSSIAHEVNQPLAGMLTNANASLRWLAGDLPHLAEARQAIRRIIRDGNRAGDERSHRGSARTVCQFAESYWTSR